MSNDSLILGLFPYARQCLAGMTFNMCLGFGFPKTACLQFGQRSRVLTGRSTSAREGRGPIYGRSSRLLLRIRMSPEGLKRAPWQGEASNCQGDPSKCQGEPLPLPGGALPLRGGAFPLRGTGLPLPGGPLSL